MHPSHKTRFSDSSLYDEVCVNCGVTDTQRASLAPCPKAPEKPSEDLRADKRRIAELTGLLREASDRVGHTDWCPAQYEDDDECTCGSTEYLVRIDAALGDARHD